MKIVVMDGRGVNPGDLDWKLFEELGQVTVYDRTPFENEEETLRRTKGAEVVLINKTVMTEGLMQKLRPELQYIGVLATGYNVVDLEAAKRLGITVTNIPSYSTPAVAQFTFGLILELCLRIGDHNRSVKRGDWEIARIFATGIPPRWSWPARPWELSAMAVSENRWQKLRMPLV